jgi:hypothetical protein
MGEGETYMRRLPIVLLLFFAVATSAFAETAQERAFAHLKALEGKWKGKSSKGWEETLTYRTIAGGSVVLSTSFDAHPGEAMATAFVLDRGTLQLTHYCMAKNQPRLVASEVSEDGKRIVFTFRDATGLRSRDQGHMDKAVFELLDANRFTSQWTWYQDGKEQWMEKITCERAD